LVFGSYVTRAVADRRSPHCHVTLVSSKPTAHRVATDRETNKSTPPAGRLDTIVTNAADTGPDHAIRGRADRGTAPYMPRT